MSQVLGVLGGMGPAATLDFLGKLQALTPANKDQDHIRVIVDINPQVPDRNDPFAQPGPVLAEMAGGLQGAGAQVLAIACNTAHAARRQSRTMSHDIRLGYLGQYMRRAMPRVRYLIRAKHSRHALLVELPAIRTIE